MNIYRPRLVTPGPTELPDASRAALQRTTHHRSEEFRALFTATHTKLQNIYHTKNDLFILSSSGTGAMEASITNTLNRGDTVIILEAGKFGKRWRQIAEAYHLDARPLTIPWGKNLHIEDLEKALTESKKIQAIFCQHCETSTGALYDIQAISKTLRKSAHKDALLIVDGISALGIHPCETDSWDIDIVISSAQKALMGPPGLAFLSFSERAWRYAHRSDLPKYYFDLHKEKAAQGRGGTAWTPAINLISALHESLTQIQQESLPRIHTRHRIIAEAIRSALRALGLKIYPENPCNGLTAFVIPEDLRTRTSIKKTLHKQYKITIAGGQEELEGKILRISHMGHTDIATIFTTFHALEYILKDLGHSIELASSLKAIQTKLYRGHTGQ